MHDRTLIRLVTRTVHPPYGHRSGLFTAAYALQHSPDLDLPEREQLRDLVQWFEAHLRTPNRLTVSRHPRADETAISWIRASAHEHLVRLRQLARLLETNGEVIAELRTDRPGYVVYEDAHQVVALPFADTPR